MGLKKDHRAQVLSHSMHAYFYGPKIWFDIKRGADSVQWKILRIFYSWRNFVGGNKEHVRVRPKLKDQQNQWWNYEDSKWLKTFELNIIKRSMRHTDSENDMIGSRWQSHTVTSTATEKETEKRILNKRV